MKQQTLTRTGFIAFMLLALSAAASAKEQTLNIAVNNINLAATLNTPKGAKAAAVIIAGSGPTDRDGNSLMLPGKNNSLKYLADALAKEKITTLRFDKRMIGASIQDGLVEADLRFGHFVSDASALADWLQERTGLPTFIIGHSEGGHIAMAAAEFVESELAGVVVLAGPGRHPADIMIGQLAAQLPPELLARSEEILTEFRAGNTVADTPVVLASLFRASVQPYMISWFANDPSEQAAALDEPLLLVYGTNDIQITPEEGETLQSAQPNAKFVTISDMNHMLKNIGSDQSKQTSSYSDPSLPVDKRLVAAVSSFLLNPEKR